MVQEKSWEITDSFWEAVKSGIPTKERDKNKEYKRAVGGGRKPMNTRIVLEAIFFVLRTGIQWKALPKRYGSSSSVHKYFLQWSKLGVFKEMWRLGLQEYDEVKVKSTSRSKRRVALLHCPNYAAVRLLTNFHEIIPFTQFSRHSP